MSITARTRRIRRAALIVTGAAAVGAIALPAAAFAHTSNAGLVTPGGSLCTSQYAHTQARVQGTASKLGAKFKVYRDGVLIGSSPTSTTAGYAAEYRPSFGNFVPGNYTICALNQQSTNTFVTVDVFIDNEF